MNKIFFSYAFKDECIDKQFLVDLQEWVVYQGYDCYIDLLDNNYNEQGFQQHLVATLKKCDIFVKMDSKEYANSKWTNLELKNAESLCIDIINIPSCCLRKLVYQNQSISKMLVNRVA